MNKTKKLLSVLLAVVMLLSTMTVMASAARTSYREVSDLTTLEAYSPYGQVTRLSTEERTSILFDFLDNILDDANINPGQLFNVAGLSLTVDLRSIDAICGTLDNVKSLRNNGLVKLVAWMLGILNDLDVSTWQSGMTRDTYAQLTIIQELAQFLNANQDVVAGVIRSGKVDLGVASSALSGLDLSIIADIPGLIKGKIFPLFERWDDDETRINELAATSGNGGMETQLSKYVTGALTKNMSIRTYKEDVNGNCTSNHTLPGAPASGVGTRHYFEKATDAKGTYIQRVIYNPTEAKYETKEENRYYRQEEVEGSGVYVYVKTNADGSTETLKYYQDDTPALHSMQADIIANNDLIDITKNSAASLLYTFIPYVFKDMAPVVLNGSMKKILGQWFGATYNYVGTRGDDAIAALDTKYGTADGDFFTKAQGVYIWEYSDYKVINGTHYWRFEDDYYVADLSGINPYFNIINWNYNISDDFLNEFIPVVNADYSTGNSPAGYSTILQGLNDFVGKVVAEVLVPTVAQAGAADATISWTAGNNSNLVSNIKALAQTIIKVSPASIFGSNYADADRYYSMLISNDNQEVLTGIACTIVQLVMPQMILPTADTMTGTGIKVGAVLAAVLRELATQLVPTKNYDALIYSDYNTKTFVSGKDNAYWLDVCLTIGTDIGYKYLTAFADMGEDKAAFAGANWTKDAKTYAESDLTVGSFKLWEARVDYIVDWALSKNEEYSWSFCNLTNYGNTTIDLATVQDPFVKVGNVLASFLPIDDILNVATTTDTDWLRTTLKDNFILAIADLNFEKIVGGASATGILNVPTTSVLRTPNVLKQIVVVVRDLLNSLLYKMCDNTATTADDPNLFATGTFTSLDTLLNQGNLATLVKTLLDHILHAYNNGLLDTVIPLLNFFVGWKMDPQSLVDPVVAFEHPGNREYIYSSDGTTATTTLKIRNNSSGMLETHRGSSTVDKHYLMYVDSITCDDSSMQITVPTGAITPGAKVTIPVTLTYSGEKVVKFTIKYHYTGKAGVEVGGAETKVVYAFVSNILSDAELTHLYSPEDNDKGYTSINAFNQYVFTNNVYKTITEYKQSIMYKGTKTSNPDLGQVPTVNSDVAPTGNGAQYFRHITAPITDYGWENKLTKDIGSTSGNLYLAQSGVTSDTVFPYGTYDMGVIAIKYFRKTWTGTEGDSKCWDIDFIYYDDKNIGKEKDYYVGLNINESMIDSSNPSATAAYTKYDTALREVVKLATLPKMEATYVNTYMPLMENAITSLKNAYDELSKYLTRTDSSSYLDTALTACEPGGEIPEINYQDYELYEYFNYADLRTATRNRLKEYTRPDATLDMYIPGTGFTEAEVRELAAAQTVEKKTFGIESTLVAPTAEEQAAQKLMYDEWKLPGYSVLSNDDLGQRLQYYYYFLSGNKLTTAKQFLAKEIAYADAQNYDSKVYSAESWAAYQAAYDTAVKVNANANALQSEVFDAKYELMKAENELLLASKSVKELGLLADLQALVDQAEVIFANPQYYAPKADVTEADAYAQLIKALGTGVDKDTKELYDNSAYEYLVFDRENTNSNLNRIAGAADRLQAAIDNFECTIKVVEKDGDATTTVDQAIRIINGINPGSIADMDALLAHVQASDPSATLAPTASKANAFGTGAKVDVNVAGIGTLTTYYVLIYGDVTGDGAVDGFDAIEASLAAAGTVTLDGVYETAADVNKADGVTSADYSALCGVATGLNAIDQKTGALS